MDPFFLPCIAIAALALVCAPVAVSAGDPTPLPKCDTDENCLAAFEVDLDGDGKLDRVGMFFRPVLRMYFVVVHTQTGEELWPFRGSLDRKRDQVTLSVRTGGGDLRCRSWAKGKTCGYPVASHDLPNSVLYLSDSKRGDFVLYMPSAYGRAQNEKGYFTVMPALEGTAEDPARVNCGRLRTGSFQGSRREKRTPANAGCRVRLMAAISEQSPQAANGTRQRKGVARPLSTQAEEYPT